MPAQETSHLPNYAVLWEATGFDEYGKARVSDVPVTVRVRWNDVVSERTQPDGTTLTISSQLVVDRDIRVGSAMAKGTAEQWRASGRQQIYEVISFNSSQDLKGRETYRTATLMKSKRQLPTSP